MTSRQDLDRFRHAPAAGVIPAPGEAQNAEFARVCLPRGSPSCRIDCLAQPPTLQCKVYPAVDRRWCLQLGDLPRAVTGDRPVTQTFTLTPEQRDAFKRSGILRLEGLLSAVGVRRAREAVLRRLEPLGLWKAGAWQLDALPRPQWPDKGLKASEVIGNRHPELAALIEESALAAAVDALLEGRPYERPGPNRRPQVLFTLPNARTWTVPSGWHSDSPRLASGQSAGVQLFAFLDVVEARGGGTLAIAGSHHLLNEGRHIRPSEFKPLLRADPFFAELLVADPPRTVRSTARTCFTGRVLSASAAADRGDDRRSGRRLVDGFTRAARGSPNAPSARA